MSLSLYLKTSLNIIGCVPSGNRSESEFFFEKSLFRKNLFACICLIMVTVFHVPVEHLFTILLLFYLHVIVLFSYQKKKMFTFIFSFFFQFVCRYAIKVHYCDFTIFYVQILTKYTHFKIFTEKLLNYINYDVLNLNKIILT